MTPMLVMLLVTLFAQSDLDTSSSPLRPYVEAFNIDRANLVRYYNVTLSPTRRDRMQRFYGEWRDRLKGIDFDKLPQDGKIDYLVFRNSIDHELAKLDFDTKSQDEVSSYIPFAGLITRLEEERQRTGQIKGQDAAARMNTLIAEIGRARKFAESQAADKAGDQQNRRVLGNRAAAAVATLRTALSAWYKFFNSYDPLFTWWVGESYQTADKELDGYGKLLREKLAGLAGGSGNGAKSGSSEDIVGNPIGREALLAELAFEMIPYTPEELVEIANKEYAWCEAEMKRASREMGFGDDWKKALEKVKTMYVEPGKQPELIRQLAHEAEKFLDDHDLVSVPAVAHETWRMEMMSPERQLIAPFFLGGETISVSYPVASMSYEQKMMTMRGNNIPFARATVFHELIPGHELQLYMASRFRPYRATMSGTPFVTEGWALYWELLFYDMKFQKTPEDRVGALFWRMHRCARIIFSLSFHLGKMTPQQCVDFLVEKVGHERDNAAGEVRRSFGGQYSPLYQAAYLLGGLQLYSLRRELVGAGKMTNRQFHDALLRENRIPVEMIRASLTGQKLSRDYRSSWHFYEGR